MRIYVAHPSSFDYENELYKPLRNSELNIKHEFVLPHEYKSQPENSKEIIKICDLFIAEVSYPSTGEGIEVGWADSFGVPVLAIYKLGSKPSRSVSLIAKKVLDYSSGDDLIKKLSEYIEVQSPQRQD